MHDRAAAFVAAMSLAGLFAFQTARAEGDAPSIVHLGFGERIVTIHSSPRGVLFTVRTSSGELMDENLTEAQLLAGHPKLYDQIRASYASGEDGNLIWAGRSPVRGESPATREVLTPP